MVNRSRVAVYLPSGEARFMRKALVLMMTTCILLAGCIEGMVEEAENLPAEIIPGCNDSTALNYDENDTSDTLCMSQEMMGAAMDDFVALMEADEIPANMGVKVTMTGVDEDMGMGAYTVVATVAENENTVHSGSDVTISSMGMTLSETWTITSSDDGGTLIQVTYMDQSFLMSSAMSMEDMVAADDDPSEEDAEEQSSDDMDMVMPDPADMVSMLSGFDDCAGDACPMPVARAYDHQDKPGISLTYSDIDGDGGESSLEMGLEMNADGTWTMVSYSLDMGDQSMGLEILSAEEVTALLTIDTTLGYEALPFTLEEADAEDEYDVFICDDGEEIPADWENDGMEDCADGSDEEPSHNWESYENGYCEWEGNLENHGEDRWSCEEDASLSYWNNWWYYCELHDEDWFCTDDYGQDSNHEYSADNGNYNESNASEEDPSFVDGMNWELYPRGYCEWEGNPDDVDEDRWSCKGADWDDWWYYCENHDVDWHCTDDKGQSADYEHSANGTEWSEPEESEVFVCDNGNEIPMDWVNDGMDDCGDNSDEGVEMQEDATNQSWTVVADAEWAFAGALDDYSVVLANCVEETDDMGETTLTCDEGNSTMYGLSEAMGDLENNSGVAFADEDASGTLTDGDTIMVGGNTSGDWTHVRLHSTSADAYSDENPMLTPGFTTILGALSLMGAALINRRD